MCTAALGVGLMAQPAFAQQPQWDSRLYNFQADSEDIVLPMPCGGGMVFRKVIIPSHGPLDDYKVTLGGQDEDMAYAESTHTAYVAGSFTQSAKERFYLIGKYEVSALQFEAMGEDCPKANVRGRLPQVNVSWMDAMTFAQEYSEWLIINAKDVMPHEDGQPGFLRLPTDTEWEFAARGGVAVSPSDFQERLFPMKEGLSSYAWFQGSKSANGKMQLTGMLKPNPLGLHDVLGNVDEMTFNPFRLNKLDRMHGQSGGFSVRGGHYLTAEQSMRVAYRQEQPYFTDKGARRSKTTGFRLVLVAPVVTSKDRLQDIRTAWNNLGTLKVTPAQKQAVAGLGGEALDDPIEELGVIIDAVTDKAAKERLSNVRLAMRASLAERDEERGRAAKASLRLGAFLGRKLRDDARAIDSLYQAYKIRKDSDPNGPRTEQYKQKLDAEQAVHEDNLRYYADTVISTSQAYTPEILDRQIEVLSVELEGRGVGHLVVYAEKFKAHVQQYSENKRVARSQWSKDWFEME